MFYKSVLHCIAVRHSYFMKFYPIGFTNIINLHTVCALCSNVNDEILVANIDEKEKAEKKFNESVRRGQTAATVEAR